MQFIPLADTDNYMWGRYPQCGPQMHVAPLHVRIISLQQSNTGQIRGDWWDVVDTGHPVTPCTCPVHQPTRSAPKEMETRSGRKWHSLGVKIVAQYRGSALRERKEYRGYIDWSFSNLCGLWILKLHTYNIPNAADLTAQDIRDAIWIASRVKPLNFPNAI